MSRPALAATRAVTVLNFLAAHPTEAFTLSDLAARLDINVASAHALLGVLTDAGYLVRHPRLRTYTLGPSVVALGSAALERHGAIDHARDAVRDLARELGLEVALTAPAGSDIVFLARAGEHQARGIAVHVGQRVPLAPPLGSVFVAWGDADEWLARADDADDMRAVLAGVRARGYSIALEADARRGLGAALDDLADKPADARLRGTVEELVADLGRREYQVRELERTRTYDVSMIAAPVFGTSGEVVLALTLIGFPPGLTAEEVAAHGERVRDAGLVVTKRSHGRLPD
jgi:DNA-binding IclR family transcriptional regulator